LTEKCTNIGYAFDLSRGAYRVLTDPLIMDRLTPKERGRRREGGPLGRSQEEKEWKGGGTVEGGKRRDGREDPFYQPVSSCTVAP